LVLTIELQNRVSSTTQLSKPFTFGHPAVLVAGFADVDATWQRGPLVSHPLSPLSLSFLPLSPLSRSLCSAVMAAPAAVPFPAEQGVAAGRRGVLRVTGVVCGGVQASQRQCSSSNRPNQPPPHLPWAPPP